MPAVPGRASRRRRPRAYHHGALRRAAIETTGALLAEIVPAGTTLREVARRLGVNHAAIHQHFGSKTALLVAVAARCYDDLAEALERAAARSRGDGRARLEAVGAAFLRFAIAHPGEMSLLSQPEMNRDALGDPELARAHDRALGFLFSAVVRAQEEGVLGPAPASDLAFTLWVFSLGYWENYRTRRGFDGNVPLEDASPRRVEAHYRRMFGLLLDGLGSD